ncbi:hypothetical protein SELMODRAFT_404107 [Selaginella moellendorffii]|uniref:Putative rRNA methyltransferase n=1 Tax=Selaginella moellendorffii TaxID=88036 RepID=D8QUA9_SELML|nr:hypothetical protein SELMODRAFT_404107 [Selaginella moellendorffii]
MGKAKKGKHRLDRFYYLAKEQGYRSRAAFKLVQLDRKYGFLSSAHSVLDLCAAPGGWMQVAVEKMPVRSVIIGVDLVPIRPVRGALSLQGDITTPKCASDIGKILDQNGLRMVDVVLHDGSPNVGGAWAKEAMTQSSLVLDSLKLATKFLAPKGTFVTKVFRSQDYNALKYAFEQLFAKVEVTKPIASRSTSAEIYVVGLKYLAPVKIDPRNLDPRFLFEEIPQPPKVGFGIVNKVLALKPSKLCRYDDANTTFRKDCTAADFVWSEKPLELLGSITSISFEDPKSSPIKDHAETTDEIKALCEDLRVLGKKEFKQLLKWCLHVRKALSKTSASEETEGDRAPEKDDDEKEEDEDEDMLKKMEELKSLMDSKSKQAKKKAAKRKQKLNARNRTGMQVDVLGDTYGERDLFSLGSIKAKKSLDRVEGADDDMLDSDDNVKDETSKQDMEQKDDEDNDVDSDVERERYNDELESFLDRAYERYRSKTESNTARRKRARMANAGDEKLWEEDVEENASEEEENEVEEEEEEEANPLVVSLPKAKLSKEQIAQQWFSQDIFAGLDQTPETDTKGPKTAKDAPPSDVTVAPGKLKRAREDFEVVAAEPSGSSDSSSDEEEDYDSDAKAEILTYAKKMLRKKDRDRIIDDAYNKYMFDDEGLPEWFADDEKRHSPRKRPVKKVAEAKARKKRRVMKKMEQARSKAAAIADQPDISNKSKNRMMDKVYKKAAATTNKRPKRELVVAKKGVRVKGGKGKLVVDRRMKKDSRSRGSGKPGKGGGKGGKTGGKGASKGKRGKPANRGKGGKPASKGNGGAKPRR